MSRERPILFAGPMVRAILAGTKTQTRRLMKPQPALYQISRDEQRIIWPGKRPPATQTSDHEQWIAGCPYGGPRLWVRETWGLHKHFDLTDWYRDSLRGRTQCPPDWELDYRAEWARDHEPNFWRPSIHMPRWASRLTLEVTEVRVQRLQDISEEDAKAEGVKRDNEPCDHKRQSCADVGCIGPGYRAAFGDLWQAINSKRASWSSNPWVFAITFRRIE